MDGILKTQLMKLETAHFEIDGKKEKDFSKPFSEIIFYKKDKKDNAIKVTFENYIVNPFPGFDLHEKWNNGIKPYSKVMYGKIVDETKGMYKFDIHSESNDKSWVGWCPKKSCHVEEIY